MPENILSIIDFLYSNNLPFALYRFPETENIKLLIQYKSSPEEFKSLDEINDKSGFMVSRFPSENDKGGGYFLTPDLIVDLDENSSISDLGTDILANHFETNDLTLHVHSTKKEEYTHNVAQVVNSILEGRFNKAVISRVLVEKTKPGFNPAKVYLKMCQTYPHAMVYFFNMPETNAWMGATPEPCLLQHEGKFKTVSLAGTRLLGHKELHEIQWGEKEIAEQAIVSRFIVKLIDNLGVENYNIKGPQNFIAGNLVHLFTSFEFQSSSLSLPWTNFLESLHPTPSVCGLPRKESLNFILENESHDRSYYSGLLGPVNLNNQTDLFVNLRCMQVGRESLLIYSGAGITDSSDPEKEWEETTNKLQTVKKVLDA